MRAGLHSAAAGKYLTFHLADRAYALLTEQVEEIVPMAELSRVPNAPTFVTGFLNLGGRLVAVVSLRELFGLPRREPELYTPLVILHASSQQIALEIDSVSSIVDIDANDIVPTTDACSLNDCATAVARVDGQQLVLLSPDRLLLEQEQKRVSELAELERRRLVELGAE